MRINLRPSARLLLALLLSLGTAWGTGCGSLSSFSRKEALKKELAENPKYSIDGIQGPNQRDLSQKAWDRKRAELLREGDQATRKSLTDFDAAQALYDQEKYGEAEKLFHKIVKERRDMHENIFAKFRRAWGIKEADTGDSIYATYGDAIEEDAIFMLAESQYAQRKYPDAEKTYQELLVKYPSTRHLDPVTRQLFRIARYWLGFPEDVGVKGDTEIKVATHETTELGEVEKPAKQPSVTSRVPVLPNLSDKTRPVFDTYGRGKQALRAIWLHDATGPLADDALMLSANHSLRTEDYVEAARLYALLREQYPDSKHLKDAYLLGSHVSLASYMGPAYDGKTLETSRELKQQMLTMFPDLTEEQRRQLESEVRKLQDAEIDRLWDLVEFYRVKRMYPAVKLHCYLIINRYPDSKYAEMARRELELTEEREAAWSKSIFNFRRESAPAVDLTPPQMPPQTPSRVALPEPGKVPDPAPQEKPIPKQDAPAEPNLLQRLNPLRRPSQPPQLQPIEPKSNAPQGTEPAEEPSNAPPEEPLRASFEKPSR